MVTELSLLQTFYQKAFDADKVRVESLIRESQTHGFECVERYGYCDKNISL